MNPLYTTTKATQKENVAVGETGRPERRLEGQCRLSGGPTCPLSMFSPTTLFLSLHHLTLLTFPLLS